MVISTCEIIFLSLVKNIYFAIFIFTAYFQPRPQRPKPKPVPVQTFVQNSGSGGGGNRNNGGDAASKPFVMCPSAMLCIPRYVICYNYPN